ncbi:LysM peptidoglycan-binding domain-containing protein [Desulfatirhabdium butyrativorans]|uniref:LysM peptidoglycan-binding domain-containing protein n=1 Tax=Desulfatirhabdium butyrativorans TaxID=340467 RepID=UPI0004269B93|nr:LysM domain-containing protein [Desulfatirhabdium butyrativorans]
MAVQHIWRMRMVRIVLVFVLIGVGQTAGLHRDALAYDLAKRYRVIPFEGRDLICESYTFADGESPETLFRQKGEIAQADFALFARIVQRINPEIEDPLHPGPGETVLLPLRFEPAENSTGEERTIVLPLLAIPDQKDAFSRSAGQAKKASTYIVKPGENLFRIVLRHFGVKGWRQRVEQILRLNPQVGDVAHLRAGDAIVLDETAPDLPPAMPDESDFQTVLRQVAAALGARLVASGDFFFPGGDGGDFQLDLRRYPLLLFPHNRKVLIDRTGGLEDASIGLMRRFWKGIRVVQVMEPLDETALMAAIETALAESGDMAGLQREQPSANVPSRNAAVARARKRNQPVVIDTGDTRALVERFFTVLGLRFRHQVQLSFPYAGTQVQTVSDFVDLPSRRPLVIDFGSLGGDAASAIGACGFAVLQFDPSEDWRFSIQRILKTLPQLEPEHYRVSPFPEEGLPCEVTRVDIVRSERRLIVPMGDIDPKTADNWIRNGFEVLSIR